MFYDDVGSGFARRYRPLVFFALLARAFGPRLFGVWTGLTLVSCIVFIVATIGLQASDTIGLAEAA